MIVQGNGLAAMPESEAEAPRPAGRASLAEWLAGLLRERILEGTYAPGFRLREVALQQEFAVSNGPIREALQQLAAEGLVMRRPRRGVCVTELGREELRDLIEMRIGLLETAAELAARRAGPDFAPRAQALMERMWDSATNGAVELQMPLGFSFTCLICEASGNPELLRIWRQLMMRLRLSIFQTLQGSALEDVLRLNARLVEAVQGGDATAARQVARDLGLRHAQDMGIATVL